MATLSDAEALRDSVSRYLDDTAKVSSVGVIRLSDGFGLRINLREQAEGTIPTEIDGVPISTRVSGRTRAH